MRKIAVFTGTRAEYGLLYWIIKGLAESEHAELQLYVGGMHLSPEFGFTVTQIEQDGFAVCERLEFLLSSDSAVGITKSMALAMISAAEVLDRNRPDILVLLGDRFEALAIAQAAMNEQIPIAHIHGGEATEGLVDEAIRHALTKLSHLHFTATEKYRQRVIQLGEHPDRVLNVGAPGIDNIVNLTLMDRGRLSEELGFDVERPYFLVTYHPVTLEESGATQVIENALIALHEIEDHGIVMTYPNADAEGRKIVQLMERFAQKHSDRVLLVKSLGQVRYLSLLKGCTAVVGNSSSGIIEAPAFQVPTINIGDRQKGRISGGTVIHCDESKSSITAAIKKVMTPEFLADCKNMANPYGNGGSSETIVDYLEKTDLTNLIKKSFYDFPVER